MFDKFKNALKSHFHRLNTSEFPGMPVIREEEIDEIVEDERVKEKEKEKGNYHINIMLFLLTFITTTFAGISSGETMLEQFLSGLPYSLTLLAILLSHEFGHYFAARHFGVKSTLPYFIPFPSIFGTMGAVIKIKSPIPDKKALFYIGTMGPIPGFILSLVAVIVGIYLSEIKPIPAGNGDVPIFIFGDSLLFSFISKIIHGELPQGYDLFLSQYAFAGWIGFFITAINLMPIGQLDGAHVLYALIGRGQLYFGWAAVFALGVMSFFFVGWVVWIVFTLVFIMVGHPKIPDGPELTLSEKIMGWSCMLIFALTFIPVPVEIM